MMCTHTHFCNYLPYELMGQMFHKVIYFIPVMLHTSWSAGWNRQIGHLQLNIKGAIKIHKLRGIAKVWDLQLC